jgi:type II secretory pathway pseudopilin PulG
MVELLVAIAIIAILASLVLAALGKVRERGNAAGTVNNLRQLSAAFLLFASEHNQTLPGNFDTRDKTDENGNPLEEWTSSWLSGRNNDSDEMSKGPQEGTIFPYVGRNEKVYRVPGLKETPDQGGGSNGKFDFAMMLRLAGASLMNVPAVCELRGQQLPTPLLIQEASDHYINHTYREGAHGFEDEASQHFSGGAYYAAIGGTVHFLKVPEENPYKASEWMAVAPSGELKSLGQPNVTTFGEWNYD